MNMLKTQLVRQLKHLNRSPRNLAGLRLVNHQIKRNLATSSNNEVEYDIDIITLKKTPKKVADVQRVKEVVQFNFLRDSKLDRDVIEQTIHDTNFTFDEDLNNFVIRYTSELEEFLRFIESSYDRKITRFNQLTAIELLNSLYIFKDYYLKNKIPSINRYNYISYNYMFDNFLKYVKKFSNFPSLLNYLLLINNHGLELLNSGIDNYRPELYMLDEVLDLSRYSLTTDTLLTEIDGNIAAYEARLSSSLEAKSDYYEALIDFYRFQNLKRIVKDFPDLVPADLFFLVNNEHFNKICAALESKREIEYPNFDYLKFIFMDSQMLYLEILTQLGEMKRANNSRVPKGQEMFESVLRLLVSGQGYHFETPLSFSFTKFKISDDFNENYEFSLIFAHNIFDHVDELRVLASMGYDLCDKSLADKVKALKFDSIVLQDRFDSLYDHLTSFSKSLVGDTTDSLQKLISNKNWYDWCQENHNSRIPKMLIDYSNLSSYPYKTIEISTDLALVLPKISAFSVKNDVCLSSIRLGLLVDLFRDDFTASEALRKLYLNNGNVFIGNLQSLIDSFNILQFNLALYELTKIKATENKNFSLFTKKELQKYFGYYGNIIKSPVILDNLEILYKSTAPKKEDPVKLTSELLKKLEDYKYPLEILKVDEFQNNFANISTEDILKKLDKRIKEILSGLNSNPSSRMSYRSINKYIDLNNILVNLFSISPKSEVLDSFIEYRQIPANFSIHEYADILCDMKESQGSDFSKMSMDQVLQASNDLVNATPPSLVYDYTRYVKFDSKLRKLLSMNGGYTDVLDTICVSNSKFNEFEKKILNKKKSKESKTEYVQIPESTHIHEFIEELTTLRNHKFTKGFKSTSSGELMKVLDSDLSNFLENSASPDSYITSQNVDGFIKLSHNLNKLFTINGGNCEVLDSVITSDSVFKNFEANKVSSCYKQLPDDFKLHEFVSEIQLLKSVLESKAYYNELISFDKIKPRTIIQVLEFISEEPGYISSKRLNLKKLARNLNVLFKYNGNNTSILDNVLINTEVFNDIEGRAQSPKSEMEQFLQTYHSELSQFFTGCKMAKYDLIDFHDISEQELIEKSTKFLDSIKQSSEYKYPMFKDLTNRLLGLYRKDPVNLAVVFRAKDGNISERHIKQIKSEVSAFMDKLATHRDLYKEDDAVDVPITEEVVEKLKQSIPVPSGKFDMSEFKDAPKHVEYAKGTDKFNFKDEGFEDSELFMRNQIFHQLDNKEIKGTSEVDELLKMTPEDIRSNYRKSKQLNEANLQKYLKNINQQKRIKEEEEFRLTKAYEWSQTRAKTKRSLEAKNYFDPLDNSPAYQHQNYLELKLDGSRSLHTKSPIKNINYRDVWAIFKELDATKAEKFIKNIDNLQKSSWKLIGGRINGKDSVFVFKKDSQNYIESSVFSKVRTMFAITGATFLMLVGLNYALEDPQVEKIGEEEVVESPVSAMISENVEVKQVPETVEATTTGWFWK